MRFVEIVAGVLVELGEDDVDVVADVTCLRQTRAVGARERHVQDLRDLLNDESFSYKNIRR